MGAKRPWKVRLHYDGTKIAPDPLDESVEPGQYVVDNDRPIDALHPFSEETAAILVAERVSRNGGSAVVLYRDPDTGVETETHRLEPFEVALAEMQQEQNGT